VVAVTAVSGRAPEGCDVEIADYTAIERSSEHKALRLKFTRKRERN